MIDPLHLQPLIVRWSSADDDHLTPVVVRAESARAAVDGCECELWVGNGFLGLLDGWLMNELTAKEPSARPPFEVQEIRPADAGEWMALNLPRPARKEKIDG